MSDTFVTEEGLAVPAVTATQMREIDRIAIEETGPNLFQMMENAGRALAVATIERLGADWRKARVVVLAGRGGNGGGGLCAARHLANRGVRVEVCLAEPDRMGEVPAYQRSILASTSAEEVLPGGLASPDIILDALLGYSLVGAPRGLAADLIDWANEAESPIVALDIPSGLDATSGAAPGASITARVTVTLALPKTGLGVERAGELLLADIGIPEGVYVRAGLAYRTPFDARFCVPIFPSSRSVA
jgi:NAD(P)H-hydrate epimerase